MRWEPLAIQQLRHIYTYYTRTAEKKVATKIRLEIKVAADGLIHHPRMGCVESNLHELTDEFRSLVTAKHYKIIYFIDDSTIVVFSIWDTRQDPDRLKNMIK